MCNDKKIHCLPKQNTKPSSSRDPPRKLANEFGGSKTQIAFETDANTGNETHTKKSTSPYSTGANTTTTTTTQSINDRGTENTNPNMLCTDNERLLMLQRFASNNYCSSDESEDSFGTENKPNQ